MSPRILAYLRLLRLPTLFTALADIFLGFLLTHSTLISDEGPNPLTSFLLLCLASAGLYLSGMVFNDYFDRLIDAQERPTRPIPKKWTRHSTRRIKKRQNKNYFMPWCWSLCMPVLG